MKLRSPLANCIWISVIPEICQADELVHHAAGVAEEKLSLANRQRWSLPSSTGCSFVNSVVRSRTPMITLDEFQRDEPHIGAAFQPD